MSHFTVDGRTLTDAERIKYAADMETEEHKDPVDSALDRAERILHLGRLLKLLRKDRDALEARIGNLQGEFDSLIEQELEVGADELTARVARLFPKVTP